MANSDGSLPALHAPDILATTRTAGLTAHDASDIKKFAASLPGGWQVMLFEDEVGSLAAMMSPACNEDFALVFSRGVTFVEVGMLADDQCQRVAAACHVQLLFRVAAAQLALRGWDDQSLHQTSPEATGP